MREQEIIAHTPFPRTRDSLAKDLHQLGLKKGSIVLVHSSLSSLGWVCGGAVTVIKALMDVITPTGTLVMPAQSSYSDPAEWENPPVPQQWWQTIRETMPAFDPNITPTRNMGQIVEVFRTMPEVRRSHHPAVSFAAWGKDREYLMKEHSLEYSLGENSPLGKLYELDGFVVLLGVGFNRCTCFHLAEYRSGTGKPVVHGAPILEAGKRVWKTYNDIEFESDCFIEIGKTFEKQNKVTKAKVGSAVARLFSVRDAVDFALNWLKNTKTYD